MRVCTVGGEFVQVVTTADRVLNQSEPTRRSRYGGDARLAVLLANERTGQTVAQTREIVAGVLAAPEHPDPCHWMNMISPACSPELSRELAALQADLSDQTANSSQVVSPAPAWRLKALRREMAARSLDGFIVPHDDEHQGEFLPLRSERLRWLTGFTGSAGVAVILESDAAIFVDGRYTLQVRMQVSEHDYEIRHLMREPVDEWLAAKSAGLRIGFDPWLHIEADVEKLRTAVAKAGGEIVACGSNPIDVIWSNQPARPLSPIVPHELQFAGQPSSEKLLEIAGFLETENLAAAVISDPASLAWLFNIRGGDVADIPVSLGFALVEQNGRATIFTDLYKVTASLSDWLPENVVVKSPDLMGSILDRISADGAQVLVDHQTGAYWFVQRIRDAGGVPRLARDPCALPKARKNAIEIAGTRNAHKRDGVALTRFLAWLDSATAAGSNVQLDELGAVEKLFEFRSEIPEFRGNSFDTISGAGPNGAIVHYRATPETNRAFESGSMYLVDSGGQYLDGTTDVTRTIAIGQPDDDMKRHFTAVLKGHIAIATARFPKGTTGVALDALARAPLWRIGVDFDHGTGHGVGSYLGVHEGPQSISPRSGTPLEPGMIVSNEPGYYRADGWGIRIENLVVVEEDPRESEREMLRCSTLTMAPIDLRLVDVDALTRDEISWLDAYHSEVRETLEPHLDQESRAWLESATRPVASTR